MQQVNRICLPNSLPLVSIALLKHLEPGYFSIQELAAYQASHHRNRDPRSCSDGSLSFVLKCSGVATTSVRNPVAAFFEISRNSNFLECVEQQIFLLSKEGKFIQLRKIPIYPRGGDREICHVPIDFSEPSGRF